MVDFGDLILCGIVYESLQCIADKNCAKSLAMALSTGYDTIISDVELKIPGIEWMDPQTIQNDLNIETHGHEIIISVAKHEMTRHAER